MYSGLKEDKIGQAWCFLPVILALMRQRQEGWAWGQLGLYSETMPIFPQNIMKEEKEEEEEEEERLTMDT
jgi:hypothetical protein